MNLRKLFRGAAALQTDHVCSAQRSSLHGGLPRLLRLPLLPLLASLACQTLANGCSHHHATTPGVPPNLSAADVLGQLRAEIASTRAARGAVQAEIFGLTSTGALGPTSLTNLSWDPSHDSVYFTSTNLGAHVPLLVSNDSAKSPPSTNVLLALAGTNLPSRYAALGANALADLENSVPAADTPEERMVRFDERLVRWLVGDASATLAGKHIVLAHLADSYWSRHDAATAAFFAHSFPDATVNAEDTCENAALAGCLDGASLLVISGEGGTSDDDNPGPLDLAAVSRAIDLAMSRRVPILYVQYDGASTPLSEMLMARFGLTTTDNYWRQERIVAFSPTSLVANSDELTAIASSVDTLIDGSFTAAAYASCLGNADGFPSCDAAALHSGLLDGLDTIRAAFNANDTQGIDPFAAGQSRILQLFAWLGDIERAGQQGTPPIAYPIDITSDAAAVARALVADSTVCLACRGLRAQPDLGTYVCDRSDVLADTCTRYEPANVARATRTLAEPFRAGDEWTSTGAYALAGVPFTATRTDARAGRVYVRIGFQRVGTTRSLQGAGATSNYDRPLYLASPWVELHADTPVVLTSPYGGPIYVRLEGSAALLGQDTVIRLANVGEHAALLDVGDPTAVSRFVSTVRDNPLPHVDLRATGFEAHLRKDRFTESAFGSVDVSSTAAGTTLRRTYDGDVSLLVADYRDHYVGSVYALAGFARPGSTLTSTLSSDVQSICQNLGLRCLDAALNARTTTQHANYDEYANCGAGCSGNPFDASWSLNPLGWGEAHELGHNLQTSLLNVAYVPSAGRDDWSQYVSRAGENSNNIFPYFVKYRFIRRVSHDAASYVDGHMDQSDLFAASQSARAGLTRAIGGATRNVIFDHACNLLGDTAPSVSDPHSEAIYSDGAYAADNGLRMSFYLQIPLRLAGHTMSEGTTLDDGFDVFPLLYALARDFRDVSGDDATWIAARDRLGFGLFARAGDAVYGGKSVSGMPGNDFLLVALSYLSGLDFRPHFAIHGVRYSSLANAQVVAHIAAGRVTGAVAQSMYVLEKDFPGLDLAATPTVPMDGVSVWPRDAFHPMTCP